MFLNVPGLLFSLWGGAYMILAVLTAKTFAFFWGLINWRICSYGQFWSVIADRWCVAIAVVLLVIRMMKLSSVHLCLCGDFPLASLIGIRWSGCGLSMAPSLYMVVEFFWAQSFGSSSSRGLLIYETFAEFTSDWISDFFYFVCCVPDAHENSAMNLLC